MMARHSLSSFGKEMKRRASVVDREVVRAMRTLVVYAVRDIASATPIKSGQAQSNWITNIGSPFPYYSANEWANAGWSDSVEIAKEVTKALRYDDVVHITNNVPYIVKLNEGTSTQAPALFVQTSLLRAQYKLKGFKISWN